MSNQRSVMTEFRFLDQKRQAEGLTAEEAARYAQLRELVGPETAGPPRSGFDVNAAAARLRESLLPAGLRGRPAEPPPPPPPAAEPPPAEAAPAPEALALEQAWAEAPFAELAPEPAEPLFDPGSLAQEVRPQAWNPEAPGYDPNAPYDEAAWIAAGYDPTATYDWSAYGYGPDGQPLQAEGAPVEGALTAEDGYAAPQDEVAAAALADADLAAPEVAFEAPAAPEEPPFEVAGELSALSDPLATALDGQPVEPVEPASTAELAPEEAPLVEAGAASWDAAPPEAVAVEAAPEAWGVAEESAPLEPAPAEAAELSWDDAIAEAPAAPEAALEQGLGPSAGAPAPAVADEELPFDPNAPFDHAKWFGRPAVAAAPAEPDLSFETAPAAPAAPFGEYDETVGALAAPGALDLGAGFEITAEAPAPEPTGEPEPPPAASDLLAASAVDLASPPAEPQADWLGDGLPATHLPAPEGAPFGAYDESAPPLPGAPAAEGALEAMLPFDPAAASAIEPGAIPEGYESGGPVLDPAALPPATGAYEDAAAFAADEMFGGPEGEGLPGGTPLELGADVPDWQPDAALEQGFELASDGSFGHVDLPPGTRTPAWGTAVAAPADGWESAPALDLTGPFDGPAAAEPVEDLPTIDGAELLEELPPEGPAPAEEAAPLPPEPAAYDLAPEPPADFDLEAAIAASPEPDLGALDGAFEAAAAVESAAYPPPDAGVQGEAEPFAEPFAEPLAEPVAEPFAEAEPLAEAAPLAEPEPAAERALLTESELFAAAEPLPPPAEAAEPAFDLASIEAAAPSPAPLEVEPAPAAEPTPDLAAAVEVHEPEPAISYEPTPAADLDLPPEIAAAYAASPGGADTFELPPAVADGLFDPPPAPEPEPEAMEAEPLPPPAPSVVIEGSHRVVLHTVDGQVKRGLLVDALLDAPVLPLQPQGAGTAEEITTEGIKAIFFMLAPGERAPAPEGKKVRVTFRDGRQVAGFSPDYQEGLAGFFMIPADTRTNTGRIWVYQSAVKAVVIS